MMLQQDDERLMGIAQRQAFEAQCSLSRSNEPDYIARLENKIELLNCKINDILKILESAEK